MIGTLEINGSFASASDDVLDLKKGKLKRHGVPLILYPNPPILSESCNSLFVKSIIWGYDFLTFIKTTKRVCFSFLINHFIFILYHSTDVWIIKVILVTKY